MVVVVNMMSQYESPFDQQDQLGYYNVQVDDGFYGVDTPTFDLHSTKRNSLVSSQDSGYSSYCSTGFSGSLPSEPLTPVGDSFDCLPEGTDASSYSQASDTVTTSQLTLTPLTSPGCSPCGSFRSTWQNITVTPFETQGSEKQEFELGPQASSALLALTQSPCQVFEHAAQAPHPIPFTAFSEEYSHSSLSDADTRHPVVELADDDSLPASPVEQRLCSRSKTTNRVRKSGSAVRLARQRKKLNAQGYSEEPAPTLRCQNFEKCGMTFVDKGHLNRHEEACVNGKGKYDCQLALLLGKEFCGKTKKQVKPVTRHDNLQQHAATHTLSGSGTARNGLVPIAVTRACIEKMAEDEETAARKIASVSTNHKVSADRNKRQRIKPATNKHEPNVHISHAVMRYLGFDCSGPGGHVWGDEEDLKGNIVGQVQLCLAWLPAKRKKQFKIEELVGPPDMMARMSEFEP